MLTTSIAAGVQLPELSTPASASDILNGKQAIGSDGNIITGSIPSQGAQTITPGTSSKTIASGRYLSGTQTIQGDTDLRASNIKNGVSIFGVTGNYGENMTEALVFKLEESSIFNSIEPIRYDGSDAVYRVDYADGFTLTSTQANDWVVSCALMLFFSTGSDDGFLYASGRFANEVQTTLTGTVTYFGFGITLGTSYAEFTFDEDFLNEYLGGTGLMLNAGWFMISPEPLWPEN